MDIQNIRSNPSKYILRTFNIGKRSGCLHLVKVQSETWSWSTGRGSLWCIPMTKVSLNDALLVRYISDVLARSRCHVTAIDIIGRRAPNLDPEVLCCKIWSNIIFSINKHEIWPKYGILSQWWLHTKIKKHPNVCLLYSAVEDTLCMTFWAKSLAECWCPTR